jgi:hypothetical protein
MRVITFLFFLLTCSKQATVSAVSRAETPENEDKCKKFAETRRRDGYLIRADVKEYCKNACTTLPGYNCPDDVVEDPFDLSKSFHGRMEELYVASKSLEDGWIVPVDAEALTLSIWFFVPWLYGLIYIIIGSSLGQESRRRGKVPHIIINLIVFGGYFFLVRERSSAPLLFNFVMMIQSFFAKSSHHIYNDVAAIAILVISIVLGALMIDDLLGQLTLGIIGLLAFVVTFYRKVTQSRQEDVFSIVSLLLTMKMGSDYCQLVFKELMIYNPATLFIRHFVLAMLPWDGRYISFFNNMCFSSGELATQFTMSNDYKSQHLYIFFAGLISYLLVFVALRCCLGLVMLRKMNADLTLGTVWTGFYSYSIDVVNPFRIIFVSVLKKDSRMFWYASIMCVFNVGEFFTAREFFMIRVFMMIFDYFIVQSGLSGVHRFLEYDVDLSGMVFEKPGAFPYFFIDKLMDVKKYCITIISDVNDRDGNVVSSTRGVGLVRKTNYGTNLLTVHHALVGKDVIRTEDETINEPIGNIELLGDSVDPPVSIGIHKTKLNGSDIRDISQNELKLVKYLFVMTPSGAVCPINDWSIDRGDIHATVNLKSGDSGSPVCAILSSGVCVLAGVVSRGDHREGSRNLISAIKLQARFSGSPGTDRPYFDVDSHLVDRTEFKKLIDLGYECRSLYAENIDEFPECFPGLDFQREPDDSEPWKYNPDEGDEDEVRGKRKKNIKSRRKDARARKQQFMVLVDFLAFDERTRSALENFAEGGDIVRFNVARRKPKRLA